MKIAILGAGMVGQAIAIDLSKKFDVTSFDLNETNLSKLKQKQPVIDCINVDLSQYQNYEKLLEGYDYVVSAVPGFMGYKTLETIINTKKNVADISFFPENALLLDKLAKQNDVTAIVDLSLIHI